MGISSISTFGKRGVTASLIGGLSVAVIAGAVSLATPGMSLTAAHVAAPGNDLPPTGTVLPLFAPAYMGSHWSMTQAQAVTIAHDFNLVAAQANIFAPYTAAMKAANPGLKIVAYLNGTFDQSAGGTKYASSWYELDAGGSKVRSRGFGNYLMNPSNPAWGQNVATECAAAMASSHYDGCFLDTMGTAPLGSGYVTGLPIDPATHAVWTANSWITATESVAAAVKAANPGAIVIPNGLSSGGKYFSPNASTAPLLTPTGAAMAEVWIRTAGQSITSFPKESKWLEDVTMLVHAETAGQSVLTTTKLFTTSNQTQQNQWHKFALASFLLAANGHSYFSFVASKSDTAIVANSAWDHVAIGTPLGAYIQSGSLFGRSFTNGVVWVNPNSTPSTVTFSAQHLNLAGVEVTSETLAPNTGDVFLQG
jgi:Hypothetical glycosyl hydrolase family 15